MKTQNTALPASVLTKKQTKTFGPRSINCDGTPAWITATVRYDDECGNGHNSFSITAEIVAKDKRRGWLAGGCCHDEVAAAFPGLAPLIKWHLTSTDGPMHYEANTIYHAESRNFAAARSGAVWPDATDAELSQEPEALRAQLRARLPALMADFKAAVESLGFTY